MIDEKIKQAQDVLKLAVELSKYYYQEPIIISYSGGKDSDVMLDIARRCLEPSDYMVGYSNTTVDAPETVRHIRGVFKDLEKEGVKCIWHHPMYKGQKTSMYKLIPEKRMPPTRLARYCCQVLKEGSWDNNVNCVGVRRAESKNRDNRDFFGDFNKDRVYRGLDHVREQFENSKMVQKDLGHGNNEIDAYDCKFIESLKKKKKIIVNPIYEFTDDDISEYIRIYQISLNPLYEMGFKRVGCVGCPLAGPKTQKEQFARYPRFKEMYLRAFDNMLRVNKSRGIKNKNWETAEDVFRWWIGENPKQVRIEDILKDDSML